MSAQPQTLGQYQIIREIARSNDIVYEAYDPLMNRRVAIKELSMPAGSTAQQVDERVSRFRREAQAVGSLNHVNIMTVHSFSEDAGRYFMAMEFLDGITLRKEIDNKGFLSVEQAVQIASDVLAGLSCAHEAGVVHRDIKPDNVQLTSAGVVKITDFGIARLTFQPNLTMDGQVFGTPSYMSPEQVVGKEIDQRTDIFSVGVMLYEMVTGNKPFTGDNVIAITHAIVNSSPTPPSNVQMSLWVCIQRALEKTPAMRYHNANEMRQALQDAVSAHRAPAAPPQPVFDPYAVGQLPLAPMGLSAPPVIDPYQQPYTPYGTPNPYFAPGQIPPPQPMSGYGQPMQGGYNPYGSAAPPPVISAPVQYGAYNPYQQPQPGQYQLPPGQFYPPPPGPPLISAQTKERMRQLMVAFVVFGLLAAILVAAFIAVTNSIQQNQSAAKREITVPKASSAPAATPTSSQGEPAASESSATESSSPSAAPEQAAPTYTGPDPREIYDDAQKASGATAKARLLVDAGNAYKEMGQLESAYDCYYEAYNTLKANNSPNRELRRTVDLMIDVTPADSDRRQKLTELRAQL
ncbi:MAG: protein kinase [Armatimonadota bacterium]